MPKTRKRRLANALFKFFTNDVVLAIAIILSVVSIFVTSYRSNDGVFLNIDALFTLFFLFEVLVKIHCVPPVYGPTTWREKFRYYWFGKYDIRKRYERMAVDSDDLSDEIALKTYRNKQYEKAKEKERQQGKGFLRKYVFFWLFDGDEETSHWNQFDFFITMITLPSILGVIVGTQDAGIQTDLFLSLRALRICRALRNAKAIRIMRFVPDIDKLVKDIRAAIRSCFVVAIGFIIFMIITSVLSSTLFGDIAPEYFGNPGQSLYSTFRLFTIEGWFDIPDAIAANSSHGMAVFAKIYFSLFLFMGGIIGVSIINSFFVDAMAEGNNEDVLVKLEEMEKMIKELKEEKDSEEKDHAGDS